MGGVLDWSVETRAMPTKSAEVIMSNVKEKMTEVIQSQPEDATYEEIMRELAFERMVARGLEDSRQGRVVPNDEMERRIRTWQK
jgi:predicted transcriptional regulator